MAINPDLRLKVRHFFRDHYRLIIIVLVIFVVLVIINRFLIKDKYTGAPQTTYTPNKSVLDSTSEVPTKVAKSFEDFIEDYVGYCNNRNYVAAWNMISTECKQKAFGNSYSTFVEYVQQKFDGNTKRYAIQNYSNLDGEYIYDVKIFNDFLATGLTNQRLTYQEEKFKVSYDDDKNIVFAIGNYMGTETLQYMASNDYLRIEVTSSIENYNFIKYKINFINRTNYTIVIQDGLSGDWEIGLSIGNEIRPTIDDLKIVLGPGESKETLLSFEKFYDSPYEPEGIILNAIRVMEHYTGNEATAESEIENAIDKFNMTIGF